MIRYEKGDDNFGINIEKEINDRKIDGSMEIK